MNLKKAEEASNSFTVPPTAMTSVYDAEEVDLSGESWYRENFTDYVDISIEYFKKDETVGKAVDKIIDAGTYKVKFTIKDSSLHKWKSGDSGSAERIMTYTVTPKKIAYPTFYGNEWQLPYNGGNDVEFQLVYDENYAKVSYNGVDLSTTSKLVSETTVGEYELTVELKDSVNCEWASSKDKFVFEITKAKVYIKLSEVGGSASDLTGLQGKSKTFNLELHQDSNKRPKNDDEVPLSIEASAKDLPTLQINVEDIKLNKNSTTMQITFNMSKLRAVKYALSGVTTNGNYEIVIDPAATWT